MPGYIIARHSSILSNPGLCQATSSRGTASFSVKPAYAKLHHREAQQHPQQPRPMPGYIIARRSFFLSNPSLCQATSSRGTAAPSSTPAHAKLRYREAQQHHSRRGVSPLSPFPPPLPHPAPTSMTLPSFPPSPRTSLAPSPHAVQCNAFFCISQNCPALSARPSKGRRLKPSPAWLQTPARRHRRRCSSR